MANHCIDCEVCGDDLRGSGQQRCTWGGCPGYVIGLEDLTKIALSHPDAELRLKAINLLKAEREKKKK